LPSSFFLCRLLWLSGEAGRVPIKKKLPCGSPPLSWVPEGSLAGDFWPGVLRTFGRNRPPGPRLDRRGPPRTSNGQKASPAEQFLNNSGGQVWGGVLEEGKRGGTKAWPKRVPTQALGARFCSSTRKIEVLWCMLGHVCHSGTPRNIYAWPLCLRYQWPRGAGVLCPTLLSHRLVRVCTYCLGALLANRTAKVVAVGFMAIFEGGIRLRA